MRPLVKLYIKPYCGWCHEVMDWLDARGIAYEKFDVTVDRAAHGAMLEASGQTRAPVIDVAGEVLADFGVEELEPFWERISRTEAS